MAIVSIVAGGFIFYALNRSGGEKPIEFGGFTIYFNEIVGTASQGTPQNLLGAFNVEVSLSYANRRLRVDFQQCIPDSLEAFDIYIEASYLPPDELFQYNIMIHGNEGEPDFRRQHGKRFYVSITNRHFSPRGGTFYDTNFDSNRKVSLINGVDVVFQFREAPVFDNPATGLSRVGYAVYVADFRIGDLGFFVTGRDGITEEEFLEFVIAIIMNYSA